jgi:hypothetical protein
MSDQRGDAMEHDISTPPKGFHFEYTVNGYPLITYRATGTTGTKVFLAIWLTLWTLGCIFFTMYAFLGPGGTNVVLLLVLILFWAGDFLVLGAIIWNFVSIMSFELGNEKLIVSRTCLKYKKKREIVKNYIVKIKQVKDGGEGAEGTFDTWGIIIEADKKYKILHYQSIEKSEWVGRILEEWSQKEFVPWHDDLKGAEYV